MSAIEMLPVVLLCMLLGALLGWFGFHSFFNGAVIGFIASFVLVGMVALATTSLRRVRQAVASRRSAGRP